LNHTPTANSETASLANALPATYNALQGAAQSGMPLPVSY